MALYKTEVTLCISNGFTTSTSYIWFLLSLFDTDIRLHRNSSIPTFYETLFGHYDQFYLFRERAMYRMFHILKYKYFLDYMYMYLEQHAVRIILCVRIKLRVCFQSSCPYSNRISHYLLQNLKVILMTVKKSCLDDFYTTTVSWCSPWLQGNAQVADCQVVSSAELWSKETACFTHAFQCFGECLAKFNLNKYKIGLKHSISLHQFQHCSYKCSEGQYSNHIIIFLSAWAACYSCKTN